MMEVQMKWMRLPWLAAWMAVVMNNPVYAEIEGSNASRTLDNVSGVLIGVIASGTVMRLIFCFIRMSTDDDQKDLYIKRAKHAGMFLAISLCVWGMRDMLIRYFK